MGNYCGRHLKRHPKHGNGRHGFWGAGEGGGFSFCFYDFENGDKTRACKDVPQTRAQ